VAAIVAASLMCAALQPAARAFAQAAGPFPEVPLPPPTKKSNTWALVTFGTGAVLLAGSFALSDAADRHYSEYLRATDPDDIQNLYNSAVLYDRLSGGAVIAGEVLLATGVYLAFLHHPTTSHISLALDPSRVGVSLRF
jgi:hypothetical protein